MVIAGGDSEPIDITQFFSIEEPEGTPLTLFLADMTVQSYNFTYYEDLFASKAEAPTPVNVLAKSYRNVQLHKPGQYTVTFTYNDGQTTVAKWDVLPLMEKPKAKNAIVFIGDGMATSMIAAARLLAHKTINGRYQTKMKMDEA